MTPPAQVETSREPIARCGRGGAGRQRARCVRRPSGAEHHRRSTASGSQLHRLLHQGTAAIHRQLGRRARGAAPNPRRRCHRRRHHRAFRRRAAHRACAGCGRARQRVVGQHLRGIGQQVRLRQFRAVQHRSVPVHLPRLGGRYACLPHDVDRRRHPRHPRHRGAEVRPRLGGGRIRELRRRNGTGRLRGAPSSSRRRPHARSRPQSARTGVFVHRHFGRILRRLPQPHVPHLPELARSHIRRSNRLSPTARTRPAGTRSPAPSASRLASPHRPAAKG